MEKEYTPAWHGKTWLIYTIWASLLLVFFSYAVKQPGMGLVTWETIASDYLLQGYSIIETYGEVNQRWIPHRVFPDITQCSKPETLEFLDFYGEKTSLFSAKVAVCQ